MIRRLSAESVMGWGMTQEGFGDRDQYDPGRLNDFFDFS
jgi:hypothetical protein